MEKKSLILLAQESAKLETQILESDGELTPEIEKALTSVEIELPEKVQGYSFNIDRFLALAEQYRKQARYYTKIAKMFEDVSDALKVNIKSAMVILNKSEIDGLDFAYRLMPAQSSLVVDDEKLIPEKFLRKVEKWEVNKEALKEALRESPDIPGAHLEPTLRKVMKK